MAQVTDEQAEQVEQVEGGAISSKALKVENELAQYFNLLDVSNQDPNFRYTWVYLGQHGLQIKMKLADGWEVVQGDMPEAVELKGMGADTTRKLGDVMLMRCRADRWLLLQRREKRKREAHSEAVGAQFEEILRPYKRYGATAIVDGRDVMTGEMIDAKRLDMMHKRSMAAAVGNRMVDQALRKGTMPGVPAVDA